MGKILKNDHAEPAPALRKVEECWYPPTFGVYHPQKPGQMVFDSSAQHGVVSLNSVLLSCPDLNNSLLGVMICFRRRKLPSPQTNLTDAPLLPRPGGSQKHFEVRVVQRQRPVQRCCQIQNEGPHLWEQSIACHRHLMD